MHSKYMQLAHYYAAQSTCKKRKVGCVVVKNGQVVAYGFNHGYDETCTCDFETKNPHVLHAEQMALQGLDKEIYRDADLYVTYQPCMQCAMECVANELKNIYYDLINMCSKSVEYLQQHGISTYVLR